MANRDASKQKRARQNRAQREAREARAKAAAVPASERQSKYASSAPKADAAPARKGFFSGGGSGADRPERKPRPGDRPVDIATLEGNWFSKRLQVPGGRQVLTGGVLAIVLSVLMLVQKFPPADDPKGKATESLFELIGWWSVPVVLVPLVAMFIAAQFTLMPFRRKVWIGASAIVALEVAMGFPVYLFPAGFLVYGVVRANKIEGPSPTSRAGRALAAAEAADANGEAETGDIDDDDEASQKS